MFDESTIPTYTHLYSVSDLHLGGYSGAWGVKPRDFRNFKDGPALAWLIDDVSRVADTCPRTALVLAGDVVDFLACRNARPFDPQNALLNLKGIIADNAFRPVWEALRRFVAAGNGDLVILLGNHDVELALPHVQSYLVRYLTGGDDNARLHLILAMDGRGFRCRVGNAEVLCVHGNEVDEYNAVDFGALHLVARAVNFEALLPSFTVNAGSTLVATAMNDIKRRFQWVDLLKPERETAIRIIGALPRELFHEVSLKRAVDAVLRIAAIARRDSVRIEKGLLGDPETVSEEDAVEAHVSSTLTQLLGPSRSGDLSDTETLIAEAERLLREGTRPVDLLAVDEMGGVEDKPEMLGVLKDVWTAIIRDTGAKKRTLRETLEEVLTYDVSFSPLAAPDAALSKLDKRVGTDIHFLLAGHTHFEKSLERFFGGTYYFNSGTWIPLIDLQDRLDEETFDKVWNILLDGSMACLEGTVGAPKLQNALSDDVDPDTLERQAEMKLTHVTRTVVHLEALTDTRADEESMQRGAVIGELAHVNGGGGAPFSLDRVNGTRRIWYPRGV